ncbi:hypothetical protein A2U01_0067111, partial [Trifolium medium]|nr:hypothetical protein [Trifolium medium]
PNCLSQRDDVHVVLKHVFEAAASRPRVVLAVLQHHGTACSQHLRETALLHNLPPCVHQDSVDEQPAAVDGLCWRVQDDDACQKIDDVWIAVIGQTLHHTVPAANL